MFGIVGITLIGFIVQIRLRSGSFVTSVMSWTGLCMIWVALVSAISITA